MTRRVAPFENLCFVPPGDARSDDGSALPLVAKSAGMGGARPNQAGDTRSFS